MIPEFGPLNLDTMEMISERKKAQRGVPIISRVGRERRRMIIPGVRNPLTCEEAIEDHSKK